MVSPPSAYTTANKNENRSDHTNNHKHDHTNHAQDDHKHDHKNDHKLYATETAQRTPKQNRNQYENLRG